MSARYGSRTRSGEGVSNFGQRGGAGGGTVEVTASFSPAPAASSSPVTIDGIEYIVWEVTANTTMTVSAPTTATAEVVVVAGGGGGGNFPAPAPYNPVGGGGGAGGAFISRKVLSSGPYPIVIGGGGAASTNGTDTTGFGETATGGGYGGNSNTPGNPGGSGGGSGGISGNAPAPVGYVFREGGTGTSGQGYNGGLSAASPVMNRVGGGAGGGAGGLGTHLIYIDNVDDRVDSAGGVGISLPNWGPITGVAGGGQSGKRPSPGGVTVLQNLHPTAGGAFGGGSGGNLPTKTGGNGTANTGGGGGGAGSGPSLPAGTGGSGGSGVVIIRYQRFQG